MTRQPAQIPGPRHLICNRCSLGALPLPNFWRSVPAVGSWASDCWEISGEAELIVTHDLVSKEAWQVSCTATEIITVESWGSTVYPMKFQINLFSGSHEIYENNMCWMGMPWEQPLVSYLNKRIWRESVGLETHGRKPTLSGESDNQKWEWLNST